MLDMMKSNQLTAAIDAVEADTVFEVASRLSGNHNPRDAVSDTATRSHSVRMETDML